MKTQSAKNKGRRLQQRVIELMVEILGANPDDLESRSMGCGGEDIVMGVSTREIFPYSIECKNQERLNVWEAYDQAKENSKGFEPILVFAKNRRKPLVAIDATAFLELVAACNKRK